MEMTSIERIVLDGRAQVASVSGRLHDAWVDLERTLWRHESGEVQIPIATTLWRKAAGRPNVMLVICGVTSFEVVDTEHVRWYNLIGVSVRDDAIEMAFGIPLVMRMGVDWMDG